MFDRQVLDELKARLADRYTAAELVDLLDIAVEDIIEEYLSVILANAELLEEVGMQVEEEVDE